MDASSTSQLLQDIPGDSPCGPNLEYDPEFLTLERTLDGGPEQQLGNAVLTAAEPNWGKVSSAAGQLLNRTKDLRLAMYLARGLLHTEGLPGLAKAIAVARGLLERYWDSLHPELDAEDDNDPTMRLNVLLSLCNRERMLRDLCNVPLVSSKRVGRFSLRDVRIAKGEIAPSESDSQGADMATVEAAFMDCDLSDLQAAQAAVDQCISDMESIGLLLADRVTTSRMPNLDAFLGTLKEIHNLLKGQLARRGVGAVPEELADGSPDEEGGSSMLTTNVRGSGEIRTREDVIRVLDLACDYFARHEPSSPVPLLLQRAKRLIPKSFLEIMRDIAPAGVEQAELIGGVEREE